ncbi:TMEM175 family protein [Vulgatibacter incomptus]|uniref:Integral membrane protein n=1 Tax=Vulgatibacter incomptus TaxID=1391653 RepID=A0A0K1PIN6_9BACT|nr:TMEM175 family protein [Vulgatibacter incomptus]AKU92974.1 Integral membrane protein [Vulgatibacter incomptus]
MDKSRLEAFSDGFLAIIITVTVLELRPPVGDEPSLLGALLPVFLSYLLSFIFLAIAWKNHHHMLYLTRDVSEAILWANLNFLFWLSLIPFTTGWMGANHFSATPTAVYGVVLLMAAIAYWILERVIIASQGRRSVLKAAVGREWKLVLSVILYVAGIVLAFVSHWIAQAIYFLVAMLWLVPDRRIDRMIIEADRRRAESSRTHEE